jgi:hypothetical protein
MKLVLREHGFQFSSRKRRDLLSHCERFDHPAIEEDPRRRVRVLEVFLNVAPQDLAANVAQSGRGLAPLANLSEMIARADSSTVA